MALSDDDVREILRIIDESDLAEIKVETDAFSLHVRRRGAETDARPPGSAPAPPPAPEPGPEPDPEPPPPTTDDGLLTIEAPMLGTFYRAEGPGQKAFVDPGSEVGPDTTVCIIEVMKMMNSIPAGLTGTIVEVLAENAELVEYGQPLFRVRPQ
jgi:acetyl-CoA carboxylase biotin carboxyl carrier protein